VTQYLSEEAVRRTLAFVGKSASGSLLVFTYVLKSMIERHSDIPGAAKMMDMMAKRNSPWLFGLEPSEVPSFLQPFHLHLLADVGNTEHQAKYLKPLGRNMVVSEVERIIQATVIRP
jgi:O-methyltransferase involved in polyketide biosynthesis